MFEISSLITGYSWPSSHAMVSELCAVERLKKVWPLLISLKTTFLSRSTAYSSETITWEDGQEYPVIKLEISNTSHPFYTGKNVLVDTAGRIDKFKKRYEKKAK